MSSQPPAWEPYSSWRVQDVDARLTIHVAGALLATAETEQRFYRDELVAANAYLEDKPIPWSRGAVDRREDLTPATRLLLAELTLAVLPSVELPRVDDPEARREFFAECARGDQVVAFAELNGWREARRRFGGRLIAVAERNLAVRAVAAAVAQLPVPEVARRSERQQRMKLELRQCRGADAPRMRVPQRARPRQRRHAARRAAGVRSGADPGGEPPLPEARCALPGVAA